MVQIHQHIVFGLTNQKALRMQNLQDSKYYII